MVFAGEKLVCQENGTDSSQKLEIDLFADFGADVLLSKAGEDEQDIVFQWEQGQKSKAHFQTSYTFSLKNVSDQQPASLKLVKVLKFGRGGCGRGGCDPIGGRKQITALLNYLGQETEFSCHEESF